MRSVNRDTAFHFALIGPEEVADLLANPDHRERTVLLEAHFTSPDHPPDAHHPNTHHIPGAIQVHPSYVEAGTDAQKYYPHYQCPADGSLMQDRELQLAIERLGITPDTPIVVYGTEPAGTMAAARLAWGLMYAGVKHVRLLDGGIDAWLAHGGSTAHSIRTAREIAATGCPRIRTTARWVVRPEILATTPEVRRCAERKGCTDGKLVDVRRIGEWDGSGTQSYPFLAHSGHIPSATHQGDWDNLVEPGTNKLGPRLDAVARRWRAQGILDAGVESRETTLIFYCGTGWRSSVSFLVALLLGLRAKNYDDGFYGWSTQGERKCP